jgi:hypothetical protein
MSAFRWLAISILAAAFVAAIPATARADGDITAPTSKKGKGKGGTSVPEVSSTGTYGLITLLVGGTVLLSTRRRKSAA